MKRKIYNKILDWKLNRANEEALLIDGARRVGKSWIAEEYAKNEYRSYIKIDFSKEKNEIVNLCEQYISRPEEFYNRLQIWSGVKLFPGQSIIIFDEVQDYPRAREAVKWLVADGKYHFLETGSLMSIKKNTQNIVIPSEEYHINMWSMDFEEFLWALDEEPLCKLIKESFQNRNPLREPFHRHAMDLLRTYIVVGGMPQAVLSYIKDKDFEKVDHIKRRILQLYRNDIYKYAGANADKVVSIWDSIPSQLQKHESRFRIGEVEEGARTRNYKEAFLWLMDAMIVNVCYGATEPGIGLKLNRDESKYKLYIADTGLLISHAFDEETLRHEELYKKIILGKLEINAGMIIENLVAQSLRTKGHALYFYSSYSKKDFADTMEIDFLIRKSGLTNRHNIIPIEVKSSKNNSFVSLEKFNKKFHQYVGESIVLSSQDVTLKEGILFLPLYTSGLL